MQTMSKLYENAIMTGCFDAYCLLCDTHLKDNTEDHIKRPDHKEKLQKATYVTKFQSHHIRKVSKGYYCEFCNILFPTLARVSLHVATKDHEHRKGMCLLKQVPEGVIAYDKVLINNEAWNGLIDSTCCLCNEEFDDEKEHLNTGSHILQLIQGKIQLVSSEVMYRIVDENTIHCMICNNMLDAKEGESHFRDENHLKNYKICCDKKISMVQTKTESPNKAANTKNDKISSQNDRQETAKKNDVKAEKEVKRVENCEMKEKQGELLRHPFEVINEAKQLAKENRIKYNQSKQSAYCTVCNVTISSSLLNIKIHIEEDVHKNKLKQNEKQALKTVPTAVVIRNFQTFTKENEMIPEFVMLSNGYGNFTIPYEGSHVLIQNRSNIRCLLCDVTVDKESMLKHTETKRHVMALCFCPVVTEYEDEFLRQLKPNVYHCGRCNLVVGGGEDLSMHCNTLEHKTLKEKFEFIHFIIMQHFM